MHFLAQIFCLNIELHLESLVVFDEARRLVVGPMAMLPVAKPGKAVVDGNGSRWCVAVAANLPFSATTFMVQSRQDHPWQLSTASPNRNWQLYIENTAVPSYLTTILRGRYWRLLNILTVIFPWKYLFNTVHWIVLYFKYLIPTKWYKDSFILYNQYAVIYWKLIWFIRLFISETPLGKVKMRLWQFIV